MLQYGNYPLRNDSELWLKKNGLAKKNARIHRLLNSASLGLNACIEDIDYTVDRTIDKKTIQTLSTCAFIEQKLNIVISGKTGTGKSVYRLCLREQRLSPRLYRQIL